MTAVPNPEGYPLATTWEDCARHVEAGGVVEVRVLGNKWTTALASVPQYRSWAGAPGKGNWAVHRLVPIIPEPPKPVTVEVDVELLERVVDRLADRAGGIQAADDWKALRNLIRGVEIIP